MSSFLKVSFTDDHRVEEFSHNDLCWIMDNKSSAQIMDSLPKWLYQTEEHGDGDWEMVWRIIRRLIRKFAGQKMENLQRYKEGK